MADEENISQTPDETPEEDSINQDELDAMLSNNSETPSGDSEATEQQPETPAEDAVSQEPAGDAFKQNELDALLGQLSGDAEAPEVETPADSASEPAEASEVVEISEEATEPVAAAEQSSDATDDSLGSLDQSELDAMVAGATGEQPAAEAESQTPEATESPAVAEEPDDPASLTIDQAELDAMLGVRDGVESSASASNSSPAPTGNNEASGINQAELDAMLQNGGATQQESTPTSNDPQSMAESVMAEMAAAIEAEKAAEQAASTAPAAAVQSGPHIVGGEINHVDVDSAVGDFPMADFDGDSAATPFSAIDLLDDVNLNVKIELGRTEMYIEDVLQLGTGSVVELNKLAGDPVDIFVNEQLIARGEVLVLNDNFCVRINAILSPIGEVSAPV